MRRKLHKKNGATPAPGPRLFRDQGSNYLLEPLAIPGGQYALPLRGIATGPYVEIHGLVVANDHCWRAFAVNHIK